MHLILYEPWNNSDSKNILDHCVNRKWKQNAKIFKSFSTDIQLKTVQKQDKVQTDKPFCFFVKEKTNKHLLWICCLQHVFKKVKYLSIHSLVACLAQLLSTLISKTWAQQLAKSASYAFFYVLDLKNLHDSVCLHERTCDPRFELLLINCEFCRLYFCLELPGTASIHHRNVTIHPLVLLILSSHTPPTNLHFCAWPSQHPVTADITANSLWDGTSAVCLCIQRWLCSPPDSIRQTALISHMRRRWTDSGDTSQRWWAFSRKHSG